MGNSINNEEKTSLEERMFETKNLEIFYNTCGNFIVFCITKTYEDGSVKYFELETGEEVDFESYAIHGYKKVKDKKIILNTLKTSYSFAELKTILEDRDGLENSNVKKKIPDEDLVDLLQVEEELINRKRENDVPVPVEQIEIRYSEVLNDFLFLYVTFSLEYGKLMYINMENGSVVNREVLSLYTYYPRDDVFKQPFYTPTEVKRIKKNLMDRKTLHKRG